jgi:hypothetical protein
VDRRLWWLAAVVPAAVVGSAAFPPLTLIAAVAVPAASIAWALAGRTLGWAAAMAPGAVAVGVAAPEGLSAFGATILAGPVIARLRAAGWSPARSLVGGAGPLAAWTLGLAVSGFDPVPEDAARAVAEFWREGDVPPERMAEIQASSEAALEALRRTWVASEVVWFWVTLAAAWWLLGRWNLRAGHPGQGAFARFDVPDAWVAVLIAGLAAVLLGGRAQAAGTVGWNLVLASGIVFTVRGTAVESFWMARAGWKAPARGLVLGAGLLLALPMFLALAAGLGLFDAWFDFRRIRATPSPESPDR